MAHSNMYNIKREVDCTPNQLHHTAINNIHQSVNQLHPTSINNIQSNNSYNNIFLQTPERTPPQNYMKHAQGAHSNTHSMGKMSVNSMSYHSQQQYTNSMQQQRYNDYYPTPAVVQNNSGGMGNIGHEYTNQWMNNDYSSGNGTFSQFGQAPTEMSYKSQFDNRSVLSITTNLTSTMANLKINTAYSTMSTNENTDPSSFQSLDRDIISLCNKFEQNDLNIKCQAAKKCKDIFKRQIHDPKIRDLVCRLLNSILRTWDDCFICILYSHNNNEFRNIYYLIFKYLAKGLEYFALNKHNHELLQYVYVFKNGSLIRSMVLILKRDEEHSNSCINIIWSLVKVMHPWGSHCRRMLRSNIEIVEKLIDCLKTKVSHYKEHMLECLFYLVFPEDKSREDIKKNPKAEAYIKMNNDQLKKLKARFRELKGFNLMMDTFATENVEPILYHSSRIIGIFLSCVSFTECTKVFLESSVIIRMAEKLSHGSSRLLHECAKCISYALDSIGLPEPKVKIIIPKIVQMLGSDDPQFAQYLSRCLVSATINSVENKNIIMICNGIQGLLALLDKYKNVDNNNFKPIYDEIMDNSLIALKNLVRDKIDPSQKYKGIEIVINNPMGLNLLMSLIQTGNIKIKNHALILLTRLMNWNDRHIHDWSRFKDLGKIVYNLLFETITNAPNMRHKMEIELSQILIRNSCQTLFILAQYESTNKSLCVCVKESFRNDSNFVDILPLLRNEDVILLMKFLYYILQNDVYVYHSYKSNNHALKVISSFRSSDDNNVKTLAGELLGVLSTIRPSN